MSDKQAHDLISFVVDDDAAKTRLDKFLAEKCADLSRARIKALILDEHVRIDQSLCVNPSLKVKAGMEIKISIPPLEDAIPQPENIPLDIVYEDDDLLVINKQVGLVVHPGAGNWIGTLVNALLHHCGDSLSGIGGVIRPGIVHRLDKDTSGLMVVAKHDKAHRHLAAQLADRSLNRHYLALVWKVPILKKGTIDQPIGRHPSQRQKMAVNTRNSKQAVTHYEVKKAYGETLSLVECKLQTGRTHQVRVHMNHLGHPLVGDSFYGLQDNAGRSLLKKAGHEENIIDSFLNFPRQALHAYKIGFIHPSGKEMRFESDVAEDMRELISLINQ